MDIGVQVKDGGRGGTKANSYEAPKPFMNAFTAPTTINYTPGADTTSRPNDPVVPNDATVNEDMVVEGACEIEYEENNQSVWYMNR